MCDIKITKGAGKEFEKEKNIFEDNRRRYIKA
jgi:hypothetical protein